MKLIQTSSIGPQTARSPEGLWIYNGLDCAVTHEVFGVLNSQLDSISRATYEFSRQLQAPVLEMGLRGVKVDQRRRREVIAILSDRLDQLEAQLNRLVQEGWGYIGFSYSSPAKVKDLLYDYLKLPPVLKDGQPTTDRNALEKLEAYNIARPILSHIKSCRDLAKTISTLRTEIDTDGRIRTSYNIGGTTTGRFSSSFSIYGTGTNLQNITEEVRSIFIADDGMKLASIDLKSGDAFIVGALEWNLFRDGKYLDACESGDIHTAVAKMVWPNLPWTGDLRQDQIIAERPYYRHHTYRFMCKKLGHGSNYGGKPYTLSQQSQIEISLVSDFQPKYFRAFPAHLRWQGWTEAQLKTKGYLISLMGRRRWFFGRRTEPDTIREALAYDPQGSLSDILNRGLLNVWRASIRGAPWQVLLQVHDSLVIQYPEELEDEVIPELLQLMAIPIDLAHQRQICIPCDVKVGWNWGEFDEDNPDGLKKYRPGADTRRRTPFTHVLDRVL